MLIGKWIEMLIEMLIEVRLETWIEMQHAKEATTPEWSG